MLAYFAASRCLDKERRNVMDLVLVLKVVQDVDLVHSWASSFQQGLDVFEVFPGF